MATGLMLFPTSIGPCGIAWGDAGLAGVQLPEAQPAQTATRLARRFAGAAEQSPPPAARHAADSIAALLAGEPLDLLDIALDMRGLPDFHVAVYDLARRILPGHTATYGEIAQRLGAPGTARAVGQALGRNPFPIVVPCHRVLAAGAALGGFSARGGLATKLKLLAIEGAQLDAVAPGLFDA
jgi:methylated-DNA-[protein]-cysteine S-methyltransferase